MTAMLASVTSSEEAEAAIAQGVDVVDIADPALGEPAALPVERTAAIVATVGGRRRTSAVAGDAAMRPDTISASVRATLGTGVDFVRVALFPDAARQLAAIAALARQTDPGRLVGTMFADRQRDAEALIPRLAAAGFRGVMLDIADKQRGRLFGHADIADLAVFMKAAHAQGLAVGFAGGLEVPDVPRLLALNADFLSFRSAISSHRDRTAPLDPHAVARIRQLIPMERAEEAPEVDYRLLSARGQYPDPVEDSRTQRVFVRELVLPVRIGAYSHERDKPQKVRFDVTVEVPRGRGEPQGMGQVFSYDLITDAIAALVATEHVDFVETLAERIGAEILRHPMAQRVAVKLEKLEIGPGAVGVEIVMDRSDAATGRNPILAMRADKNVKPGA
jgi:FolB domain-containing protein